MKVGMISLLSGVDEGKTFLLKNLSVFEGGRSAGNHVLLKDSSVAMSHFRICRNADEYVLYDQGAKNGTFVNGEPCEKGALAAGDIIRAGDVEMRFDLVDEDTPGRLASSAPEIEELKHAAAETASLADESDEIQDEMPPADGGYEEDELAASVEIVEGEEKGKVYRLAADEQFAIGRSSSCNLRLRDSKVSRTHCVLSRVGDHFIVADNQSSNGTVVNGEKIRKTVLKDGDYIRLGFTILRFRVKTRVEA